MQLSQTWIIMLYRHAKQGTGMPVHVQLLPAQVHSGEQSEAAPSASASREASVLELADLDREVTCHSMYFIQYQAQAIRPFPALHAPHARC